MRGEGHMQKSWKIANRASDGVRSVRILSWTLLGVGAAALVTSIVYVSLILAFVALSLVFWGALLLYVQPEEYVRKRLLDSTLTPSLENLSQIIEELDYKGEAVYLPPRYFEDPRASKLYIPKEKKGKLPTPESVIKNKPRLLMENPKGLLLTPPGAEMAELFEETLGTNFTKQDLAYLQQNLPKLLIEDLEIAEDLEIDIGNSQEDKEMTDSTPITIHVKMTNPILQSIWEKNRGFSHILEKIGSPTLSAIACALTKTIGEPISIQAIQVTEHGRIIEADYRVLETTIPPEQPGKTQIETLEPIESSPSSLLNRASLLLIAIGSVILIYLGWLTWYDTTTWGKNLFRIFFGSRTGESLDLGIGMRVVYYFVIGLALLLSGVITFAQRRQSRSDAQSQM